MARPTLPIDGNTAWGNMVRDAINALADGLDTAPVELRASNSGTGAYPTRPATTRPVHFLGVNPPPNTGVVTGGGGMVPNLDTWFWWSA